MRWGWSYFDQRTECVVDLLGYRLQEVNIFCGQEGCEGTDHREREEAHVGDQQSDTDMQSGDSQEDIPSAWFEPYQGWE